jgi:hypothetical protein
MVSQLRPLPAKSSIYNHINCINKINSTTKKVGKNVLKNCDVISLLSFFNDIGLLKTEMRKSKNKLTKHELEFASSVKYPLLKAEVMRKVSQLLQQTGTLLQNEVTINNSTQPLEYKITKGENYQHMPYMVLDYPQIKQAEFPLVCRTMFWWGHYFTFNLIVRTDTLQLLPTAAALGALKHTLVLVGDDLWEQDVHGEAYAKLHKLSIKQLLKRTETKTHLKLTRKIALKHFADVPHKALQTYTEWLQAIQLKQP